MLLELLAFALFTGLVIWRLRSGFEEGLFFAIPLLVFLPTYLRITLPQPLPAMTIHRMILILLFFAWMRKPALPSWAPRTIFKGVFGFWVFSEMMAVIFTQISFVTSVKDFLDHVFEVVVYFFMISSVVRDGPTALR